MTKNRVRIMQFWLLALLAAVLSTAPAMAQLQPVYVGQTSELSVVQEPDIAYHWEFYSDPTVNFAVTDGNVSSNDVEFIDGVHELSTVKVRWKTPGTYFYKTRLTNSYGGQNFRIGRVEVMPGGPTALLAVNPGEICSGEWATLTVTFTGTQPWSMKLQLRNKDGTTIQEYKDIGATSNPYEIPVGPTLTTEYTVIEVRDASGNSRDPSNSVSLTVNPLPRSSRIYLKQN